MLIQKDQRNYIDDKISSKITMTNNKKSDSDNNQIIYQYNLNEFAKDQKIILGKLSLQEKMIKQQQLILNELIRQGQLIEIGYKQTH